MKKSILILVILSCSVGFFFVSCVSNKKFLASQDRVANLSKDSVNVHNQLNDCNTQVKQVKEQVTAMESENALVQNVLKATSSESKMTIADQAARLKTLQDIIRSQRQVMVNLQNSIAEALMSYKTDELSVFVKDGQVYVSLEEKLLFSSGSDVVNPQGAEALKSLAKVLNTASDINVIIEGYTDNVPIKTKQFADNWDLSTARAASIVRILTKDYGFDPTRITAAGRGEYHPVKPNDTDAGRAANRRTEVIISPDLSELFKLLYQ
jgi:chemotaxis protein MotB